MRTSSWALGGLVILLLVVGAFTLLFIGPGSIGGDHAMGPPAETCPRLGFSERRCQGVVEQAINLSGIPRSDIATVEVGLPAGPTTELGGYRSAQVRLLLADGRVIDLDVWCIGVGNGPRPWCAADGL